MMNRLVLIDGHAILHRAYHALPPLTNRSGELVNAVYGFCSILLKVVDDLQPQYLAVAFDTPKPTFRKMEYIGYQIKRPKTDEELSGQIGKTQELLEAFAVPVFEAPGFEADDVIATLAEQAVKDTKILRYKDIKGKKSVKSLNFSISKKFREAKVSQYPNIEVIIVTGDKDLFQLVKKNVKIYMPLRGLSESQIFDEEAVLEKMGVKPSQIVDYKALAGDSSDNYPGVPGIGPKTAIGLLEKFGSFEKVYQNLSEVSSPTVVARLKEGKESGFLSQKLATVVIDAPVKLDLEKAKIGDFKSEKAIEFLRQLGFKSLVARLSGGKVRDRVRVEKQEKTQQERLF